MLLPLILQTGDNKQAFYVKDYFLIYSKKPKKTKLRRKKKGNKERTAIVSLSCPVYCL